MASTTSASTTSTTVAAKTWYVCHSINSQMDFGQRDVANISGVKYLRWRQLWDLFNEVAVAPATTVAKMGSQGHKINTVDTDVRNSQTLKNVYMNSGDHGTDYRMLSQLSSSTLKVIMSYWDMHMYVPGGKFVKHTDGSKGPGHIGTILVFPPANYQPYSPRYQAMNVSTYALTPVSFEDAYNDSPVPAEVILDREHIRNYEPESFDGGDLILYLPTGEVVTLKPSTFTQWTMVAFRLEVAHECTPVTRGRRCVFKQDVSISSDYVCVGVTAPAAAVDMDAAAMATAMEKWRQDRQQLLAAKMVKKQAKLERLQARLAEHAAEAATLATAAFPPRQEDMLKSAQNDDSFWFIFDKYYPHAVDSDDIAEDEGIEGTVDPATLEGVDRLVWNRIVQTHPFSRIVSMSGLTKGRSEDTGKRWLAPPSIIEDMGDSVYYQVPNVEGQFVENTSEYNDEVYYNQDHHNVTVVWASKRPLDVAAVPTKE